jgi:hypothetical protein
LRAPPPLTPQGTIAQPEPEKSLIQKYWVYVAVALIALREWLEFCCPPVVG